jgi:hypothetical protein
MARLLSNMRFNAGIRSFPCIDRVSTRMDGGPCAPTFPGGQHCRFHLSSRLRRLAVSARPASVSRFLGFNKRDRNLPRPRGSL